MNSQRMPVSVRALRNLLAGTAALGRLVPAMTSTSFVKYID